MGEVDPGRGMRGHGPALTLGTKAVTVGPPETMAMSIVSIALQNAGKVLSYTFVHGSLSHGWC